MDSLKYTENRIYRNDTKLKLFYLNIYFKTRIRSMKTRLKSNKPILKNNLFLLFVFVLFLNSISKSFAQSQNENDLVFPIKEKNINDQILTKPNPPRQKIKPIRTTSTKTTKAQSTSKTTSPYKTTTKITTTSSISQHTPVFIYSSETLNQTHADMFSNWIESKSEELFELSMNYSGYKLLNETYNIQLRKDASFAWINFTEMIVNISKTISEVLYNKTIVVKNLTDLVERAFDEYRNDTKRVKDSATYLYYDAKSPKTFCDVQDQMRSMGMMNKQNLTKEITSSTSSSYSVKSTTRKQQQQPIQGPSKSSASDSLKNLTSEQQMKYLFKRSHFNLDLFDDNIEDDDVEDDDIENPFSDDFNLKKNAENDGKNKEEDDFDVDDDKNCPYINVFSKYQKNSSHDHESHLKRMINKRVKKQAGVTNAPKGTSGAANQKVTNKPGGRTGTGKPRTGTGKGTTGPGGISRSRTSTAATTTSSPVLYDDLDERTDIEAYDDYSMGLHFYNEKSPFWNITCINRTFDENFKNLQKGVNRNQSTVHVPTNVYKQDISINMTAYWTEALNEQFRQNYDSDNELFWQYFCSSNGLFRRYPGAYWTVPANEDFFDCRLQSWYIMAAASPKDVLILMDRSGSMTGLRLEIAKKLIAAIMDTLSDNDFFNILTFSDKVDYLMNLKNESMYRNRFIQAGKTNKNKFIQKLKWFKDTANIANFDDALIKSFELLLDKNLKSDSCGCNKVIMILTDGASENAEAVFKKYNWNNGRQVRVFTFLIGRDMMDPRQVKWMACANDGSFFHVATLADVNEHVHEYIPVLSRPMALLGHHETTWSNVFVGHLDKELKIAVARPAFKTRESLLSRVDLIPKASDYFKMLKDTLKTTTTTATTTETQYEYDEENEYGDEEYNEEYAEQNQDEPQNQILQNEVKQDSTTNNQPSDEAQKFIEVEDKNEENEEEEENILHLTDEIIREQQVLLGVVGVDVPVLRLISKVSPKYQMGVGIYIIMLDNNGFIVFHPSIKKEITKDDFNFKGSSHSIDLDKFEIPIGNDAEFEELEHEMIDQKTSNKTLDNWKREGLRVIRRRTEYVYTPVSKTPFSVAIASPNSFGRFYIDLPSEKETDYEKRLRELMKNKYETNIQLYNCTYTYTRLAEKILNPKQYTDYCIRYLFQDKDQVLAIKSDLVFHNIYYNLYNFSIFSEHPNLVKSSFYGTYSGITFYLPVTFYKIKPGLTVSKATTASYSKINPPTAKPIPTTEAPLSTTRKIPLFQETTVAELTEPPSEMTINVELGSIMEPLVKFTKPTLVEPNLNQNKTFNITAIKPINGPTDNESDTYFLALNLFSTESNKHTYSFEKPYYTRSIEFSDYLRTEFNLTDPVVNYFLNETSKEFRKETVSATIPIWLDKVPTAVTGVVYDAKKLQELLFDNFMAPNCAQNSCRNVCSPKRGMNVTCYLVDEHGFVVLSTSERLSKQIKEPIMGQPLYKVNPWLMKRLEFEGIYDLVLPGSKLAECKELPRTFNSSSSLRNLINFLISTIISIINQFIQMISKLGTYLIAYLFGSNELIQVFDRFGYLAPHVNAQGPKTPTLIERIEIFNNEWRGKNSHCYYFGIYSFNLTKWKTLDHSEMRVWCNSTSPFNGYPRKFLTGYIKHSNLIMLVVEDEFELIHCGNMSQLIENHFGPSYDKTNLTNLNDNQTNSTFDFKTQNNYQETYFNTTDSSINEYVLPSSELSVNDSNLTQSSEVVYHDRNDFSINRYRKKPDSCYNFFLDEKEYLPCPNNACILKLTTFNKFLLIITIILINLF